MSNFAPTRSNFDTGDNRWLRDPHKAETHGVSVTTAQVTPDGTGLVKSGRLVANQGLVFNDFTLKTGEKHLIAVVHAGTVDRRYLPVALTLAQETALRTISFINGVVPA